MIQRVRSTSARDLDQLDCLSRRDDADADADDPMVADVEQVVVSRHDELGAARRRCGDDVIVVGIAGHHARHLGRRHWGQAVFFTSQALVNSHPGAAHWYRELASGRIYTQSDPIGLAKGINPYAYVG